MNIKRIWQITLLTCGLIFVLSACSPAEEETATPESIAPAFSPIVSATGVVVPEQEASLSVSAGGVVEDVLVNKGDDVSAGQVLVQMEGSEQQLAAVTAAELELANAKFALDALYKDTNLLAAQALRSAETAEKALEDLNNPELQQALALQAVADAVALGTLGPRIESSQAAVGREPERPLVGQGPQHLSHHPGEHLVREVDEDVAAHDEVPASLPEPPGERHRVVDHVVALEADVP